MSSTPLTPALCSGVPFAILLLVTTPQAFAATFNVTKVADTADGSCDADCSFREAVIAANANPGADAIILPAGNYELTIDDGPGVDEDAAQTGDFDVTDDLTIVGAGEASTALDGNQNDRLLDICPPTSSCGKETRVGISDLSIENGYADEDPVFEQPPGIGGGIRTKATTTLSRVTLRNNQSREDGPGVANWFRGALALFDCTVTGNRGNPAPDPLIPEEVAGSVANWGLVVGSDPVLELTRTVVSNNTQDFFAAAGVVSDGDLTIVDSVISGNRAAKPAVSCQMGTAAGIRSSKAFQLIRSVVENNEACNFAGGMRVQAGPFTMIDSVVSGNRALNEPAGGILLETFLPVRIINSTISGNQAIGGGGGSGGLAINAAGAPISLVNSTVADNDGGGNCDGICVDGGEVTLKNTIVAGNDCSNSGIVSLGNNVEFNSSGGNTCNLTQPTDQPNTDPELGPLEDNGGPTFTHAISDDSPALDAADPLACPENDQRGIPRAPAGPACGFCDIGAFEQGNPFTIAVTKQVDTNDGSCDPADCSLREAILAANAKLGHDTILLPAGTYTLSIPGTDEDLGATGDLDIRDAVTLVGADASETVIDAAGLDRVLETVYGTCTPAVSICGVTFTNGSTELALFGDGGAVYNGCGSLTVSQSVIRDSRAGNVGGGLSAEVGIPTTLIDVEVVDNQAQVQGGGLYHLGPLRLHRGQIVGNQALGVNVEGGGLFSNSGPAIISDSTFAGNSAARGGGIAAGGLVEMTGSTIQMNSAVSLGGGLYLVFDEANVTNSTISGNSADPANGLGGGIACDTSCSLKLAHSTIADNTAHAGDGIWTLGSVEASGTILADDCNGGVLSLGNNIDALGACSLSDPTDQIGVDPKLTALADHGGQTETHDLLADSPGIDWIQPASCLGATGDALSGDQRGFPRPWDGDGDAAADCDVGSVEFAADGDGDGVLDSTDNCLDVPNGPDAGVCYVGGVQLDGNQDGYGNPCDMDFNDDGLHTGADVAPFIAAIGATDPRADINCDGVMTGADVGPGMGALEASPSPGPSGLSCAGTIPCP